MLVFQVYINLAIVKGRILIKSRFEFRTEMNSIRNSRTMKKVYSSHWEKKKKKLKFNLQFTFLTGISDNYIMIKTAPNRQTDHASERETYKGTLSTFRLTNQAHLNPRTHTHTDTQAHSLHS